ncbi:MAG: DNA polymerase III subunit gamma/tau [Paludibacteraceae bacterium]|nr:DNA polymerase III subunit gamma/tau [Paludibacteraceae bacterium]
MDNYIVSSRKYRPTTFESVVGQKALTETLRNAIRQNHLAHAYLFCGPRGVGKTTCARIFAKTINCLNPTDTLDACNECESCRAFNEQRSFNIHELDAASNNSVDDIRQLINEVRIPPQIGKYSVYIIDEVHMLSQGAFNALLKTLEEPPSYAVFILATTEKHKVLPTILSRCQVYDFQRITVADIVEHLKYVAAAEGVTADEQALNVVAQKADGGMRDALSIFDQLVAFCGNNITYQQTIAVLNVLDTDYYFRLVQHALSGDVTQALLLFNDVLLHGFDAGVFVTGLAQHLRDVLVSKDSQTLPLLETSDAIRQQYAEQAKACPAQWIFQALDLINTCDINYRTARNKRLTVELCLVKLCQMVNPTPTPQQPPLKPQQPQQAQSQQPQPAMRPAATPNATQPAKTINRIPAITTINPNRQAAPSQPSATANTQQQNSPFTIDLLQDAWTGLKQHFPREERLAAIFSNNRPTLDKDGTTIHIAVANPWMKQDLIEVQTKILSVLKRSLHNDLIRLVVDVQEQTHTPQAFTAAERYKQLVKDYPVVAELKSALALQLE